MNNWRTTTKRTSLGDLYIESPGGRKYSAHDWHPTDHPQCARMRLEQYNAEALTTRKDALKVLTTLSHLFGCDTPKLSFLGWQKRRSNGDYHQVTKMLRLFPSGKNMGTLLHEFAHHLQRAENKKVGWHGQEFKAWEIKVFQVWEDQNKPHKS